METKALKVLVIEDNGGLALFIQTLLRKAPRPKFEVGYEPHLTPGLHRLRKERFDVLILDHDVTLRTDAAALTKISVFAPEAAIVLLTDREHERSALKDLRGNAQAYLVKGEFDAEVLTATLGYAVARRRLRAQAQV